MRILTKYTLIYSSLAAMMFAGCGKGSQNPTESISTNKKSNSDTYINKVNTGDEEKYLSQYDQHKTLFIDLKNSENSEEINKLMSKIGGLSIQGKFILLEKSIEGPKYIVFQEEPTEQELNKLTEKLKNTIKNIFDSDSNDSLNGSTATVTLMRKNIECKMRMYYRTLTTNYTETKDYCDSDAFVELNYKIDMSGSKATLKEDPKTGRLVKTENGKYLMITVSPYEEGGTGWHLRDEIKQGHNWFQSWANRRDFVGPFANKYKFWIKNNTLNSDVSLVETFPQNTNPESTVTESHGVTVGLSGGLKAGLDAKGQPYGNVDLGASVQVSDRRDVSYKTQEYSVENDSYNSRASWVWNSKVTDKVCDYLTKKDFNFCYFTGPLWDSNWTANKNKFSAISHKAFTPSFQAIYKAKSEAVGTSSFEVGTNVETGVILGSVIPDVLFSLFRISTDTYVTPDIKETFTIDWSSPYFAAEQNIRLQNISSIQNTKCLVADRSGKVTQENCKESRKQVWGYDNEEKQFISRIANKYCLAVNPDNTIEIKDCSMDNNQKWKLNSNGNIELYVDASKVIGIDSNDQVRLVDINSDKSIKFEAYKAKL